MADIWIDKTFQNNHFLFHAEATGAAGQITSVTDEAETKQQVNLVSPVHGQSSLPLIGGLSLSHVAGSLPRFAEFFQYGLCKTSAEGSTTVTQQHDTDNLSADAAQSIRRPKEDIVTAEVTIHSEVSDVRVINHPLKEDEMPGVHSIEFQADKIQLGVHSSYPKQGSPTFRILESSALGMQIVLKRRETTEYLPVRLIFDTERVNCGPANFPDHYPGAYSEPLQDGLVISSIVKQIQVGTKAPLDGHVLVIPGFGRIYFGEMVVSEYSRRLTMVRIKMGCKATGSVLFVGVEPNGVWN